MKTLLANEFDEYLKNLKIIDTDEDDILEKKEDKISIYNINPENFKIFLKVEETDNVSIALVLQPEMDSKYINNNTVLFIDINEENDEFQLTICNYLVASVNSQLCDDYDYNEPKWVNDDIYISIKDSITNELLFECTLNEVHFYRTLNELYFGKYNLLETDINYNRIDDIYYNYNKLLENNNTIVNVTIR